MVRRLGSSSSPSLISDLYAWMPIAFFIFMAATIIGSRHFRLRSSSAGPPASACGEAAPPTMPPEAADPPPPPPVVMLPNRTDMRFSLRLVACSSLRRVDGGSMINNSSARRTLFATIALVTMAEQQQPHTRSTPEQRAKGMGRRRRR
uniref:Uncharacterized protein n=1 Tax=Anopheles merus TaxID=30066 RepID=A0A182UMC2_ANOME